MTDADTITQLLRRAARICEAVAEVQEHPNTAPLTVGYLEGVADGLTWTDDASAVPLRDASTFYRTLAAQLRALASNV